MLDELLQQTRRPSVGADELGAPEPQPGVHQERKRHKNDKPEYGMPDGHERRPPRLLEAGA